MVSSPLSSQVTKALWVLWTQAPMVSKLDIRGILSQVQVLKGGVPNMGFKLFAPQEEAVGFEFPFDYGSWCLTVGFRVRLCSCPLTTSIWAALICQVSPSHQVALGFPPAGHCSICSCRFGVPRIFLGQHLDSLSFAIARILFLKLYLQFLITYIFLE